jgi:HSP20 family protein
MKEHTSTKTTVPTVTEKVPGAVVRPEAATRWNPWMEMADLRRRTDELFNLAFGFTPFNYTPLSSLIPGEVTTVEPEVDIHETEKTLQFLIALPGYTADQIDVRVTAETLVIQGKRETLLNKEAIKTHRNSGITDFTNFNFVYTLPCLIDPNGVKATFVNGVLNLELPKVVPTVPEGVKINVIPG